MKGLGLGGLFSSFQFPLWAAITMNVKYTQKLILQILCMPNFALFWTMTHKKRLWRLRLLGLHSLTQAWLDWQWAWASWNERNNCVPGLLWKFPMGFHFYLQLSELEQRVIEAETRAEDAEGKVSEIALLWWSDVPILTGGARVHFLVVRIEDDAVRVILCNSLRFANFSLLAS